MGDGGDGDGPRSNDGDDHQDEDYHGDDSSLDYCQHQLLQQYHLLCQPPIP